MTDPTPVATVDPDLVEVVARADHAQSRICRFWPYERCDHVDEHERRGAYLVRALAEHGALMPTGGETREEWCVTYLAWNGVQAMWTDVLGTREEAEEWAAQGRKEHAESGRWPNLLVERRTVTTWPEGHPLAGTHYGLWRQIDG